MKLCKFGTSVKDPVVKTVVTTIQFQQSNNSTQRFNCIVFLCICLFPEISYYWNQTFDSSQTYYYTKEKANRRLRATYIHIGYAFHIFAQLSSNAMLCYAMYVCANVRMCNLYTNIRTYSHARTHTRARSAKISTRTCVIVVLRSCVFFSCWYLLSSYLCSSVCTVFVHAYRTSVCVHVHKSIFKCGSFWCWNMPIPMNLLK